MGYTITVSLPKKSKDRYAKNLEEAGPNEFVLARVLQRIAFDGTDKQSVGIAPLYLHQAMVISRNANLQDELSEALAIYF